MGMYMWRAVVSVILASSIMLGSATRAPAVGVESSETTPEQKMRLFIPIPTVSTTTPSVSPDWLDYANSFRAMAGLPPLIEDSSWSNGAGLHARYVVKNDAITHDETPGNPWYAPDGAAVAPNSNVIGTPLVDRTDRWAIDSWMMAPFHAVGILDPQLLRTGFGSYREADGGIQMSAVLDVLSGLGTLPAGVTFPLLWPGPGAIVPLRMHWDESPDPLASCPGYVVPTGLPVIMQVGAGSKTPVVTAHAFSRAGVPLEHCVFDESTYVNPDGALQDAGRSILKIRDAVVLIPRDPLAPNTTYTVSLTVDGRTDTWSFTVGDIP